MRNDGFDRKSFWNTLVQTSMRAIRKGPEALENVYRGYKSLIENQIKSTPQKEHECKELMQILEKTYAAFSDSEMVDIILKNSVTPKQFIIRYGERILGDNKRKYDMSDRLNPSLIAYQDEELMTRKVKYVPRHGSEHCYLSPEGKKVGIQEIGSIIYEEWNGVTSGLSKYRVTREVGRDIYQTYDIFSNIRIIMMEQPEYREAVLEELLSQNNMQLSNVGGYVGDIEEVTVNEEGFKEGAETVIAGDYSYRVNQKYMLTYHAERIAATMIFQKGKQLKEKENEEFIDTMSALSEKNESRWTGEGRMVGGDVR